MRFRDETSDFQVFGEVVWDNEYKLPDRFPGDATILDIGAHIGCFALSCLKRGASRVICYEADPENFWLLQVNMAAYAPAVEVYNNAVWRSDFLERVEVVPVYPRSAISQVRRAEGNGQDPVALDSILRQIGPVHLLKLDCEGSECPILFTSEHLDRVEKIVGEIHFKIPWEGKPNTMEGMLDFLREQGYKARGEVHPDHPEYIGLFWAERE